jgi:cytochrome bd-type quinol oxidase subunit 2
VIDNADADALTAGERRLRSLLRIWTLLFAAGAVSFGVDPDRATGSLSVLPGPPLPESTEKYWNALAVSLMATLTTLCAIAATDVRRRRAFVWPVLVSKAVSSGMFATRFRSEPKTPYLVGAAVDGSIFAVTLRAFAGARRRG